MREWILEHDPLTFRIWRDSVVEARGYHARSDYVELFWLPVIGPSSLLTLRRLSVWLEASPEGVTEPLEVLSSHLGLGRVANANSTLVRTLKRLGDFYLVERSGDELVVRVRVGPVPARMLVKLPPGLRACHEQWQR